MTPDDFSTRIRAALAHYHEDRGRWPYRTFRQRQAAAVLLDAIEQAAQQLADTQQAETRKALVKTDKERVGAIADHMHALDQLAAAKTSANGWADRVALLNAELVEVRETIASLQGELAITRGAQPLADVLRGSDAAPEATSAPPATPEPPTERATTAAKPRKPRNPTPTKGATGEAGKTAQSDA